MTAMESVQIDIAADRAQIHAAATELRDEVKTRVQRASATVDPRTYARQYPWIALGLIVGAGFAIGYSGADRKAAEGLVDGAKKAGEAISDGAVAAKDAVVERVSGGDADTAVTEPETPGAGSRVGEAVRGLLMQGLDELMTGLRRA